MATGQPKDAAPGAGDSWGIGHSTVRESDGFRLAAAAALLEANGRILLHAGRELQRLMVRGPYVVTPEVLSTVGNAGERVFDALELLHEVAGRDPAIVQDEVRGAVGGGRG